jgi:hypothetical protein
MLVSNNTFAVSVKYRTLYSGMTPTGIEVLDDDASGPEVKQLVCQMVGRHAEGMSRVLEASTIVNHVTGRPLVRRAVFYRQVMNTFCKGWNLADKTGPIPLTADRINHMEDDGLRAVVYKWLQMTGRGVK